jgi:hypothetical protein
MARIRAELKEGSSYTFLNGSTFVKGTPQILTNPKDIRLVSRCGFFTITDMEAEEAAHRAELEAAKASAEAMAAPMPDGRPKVKPRRSKGR